MERNTLRWRYLEFEKLKEGFHRLCTVECIYLRWHPFGVCETHNREEHHVGPTLASVLRILVLESLMFHGVFHLCILRLYCAASFSFFPSAEISTLCIVISF